MTVSLYPKRRHGRHLVSYNLEIIAGAATRRFCVMLILLILLMHLRSDPQFAVNALFQGQKSAVSGYQRVKSEHTAAVPV